MATNGCLLRIDGNGVVQALQQVLERLNLETDEGELVLDFSSVRRIDPSALRALEDLAGAANGEGRVVLSGVSVDVYKVLKLMQLAPRFSFRP